MEGTENNRQDTPNHRFITRKRLPNNSPFVSLPSQSNRSPVVTQFRSTPRFGFATPRPATQSKACSRPVPDDPVEDPVTPSSPSQPPLWKDLVRNYPQSTIALSQHDSLEIESSQPSNHESGALSPGSAERPRKRRRLSISPSSSSTPSRPSPTPRPLRFERTLPDDEQQLVASYREEDDSENELATESSSQDNHTDESDGEVEFVRKRESAGYPGSKHGGSTAQFRTQHPALTFTGPRSVFRSAPRFVSLEQNVSDGPEINGHHKIFSPAKRGEQYISGGLAENLYNWLAKSVSGSNNVEYNTLTVMDMVQGRDMSLVRGQGHADPKKLGLENVVMASELQVILGDGVNLDKARSPPHTLSVPCPTWHVDIAGQRWQVLYTVNAC